MLRLDRKSQLNVQVCLFSYLRGTMPGLPEVKRLSNLCPHLPICPTLGLLSTQRPTSVGRNAGQVRNQVCSYTCERWQCPPFMKRAVFACLTLQRRLSSSSAAFRTPPNTERTGLFGFVELQEPKDWDTFARSSIARQRTIQPSSLIHSTCARLCYEPKRLGTTCRCNELVTDVTTSAERGSTIRAVDDISDTVRAPT